LEITTDPVPQRATMPHSVYVAFSICQGEQTMENRAGNRRQVLQVLAAGGLAGLLACSPALAAAEKYPRIRGAIKELREAKKELEEGAKIFGGHRVKAVKAVEDAIEQLQKALDFAEKN
jgi:hypothetical protein